LSRHTPSKEWWKWYWLLVVPIPMVGGFAFVQNTFKVTLNFILMLSEISLNGSQQ
jgi:hypothetical protein